MDILKIIDKLVLRATNEVVPTVDVTGQVLWRLRAQGLEQPVPIVPMSIVAGLSAVAASIIIFLAINAWLALSNPMMELYRPVQVASIW